jgi:LmbE family N-acetylglucosaminyl deacetylase
MKLVAHLALALTLVTPLTTAVAVAQSQSDPANLRGERPTPTNGRELPIDKGASGLAQLLRKLNTRASILNIVAHPDDEDGGMLTLYSRGLGARVADLSLTRGEGGQNAVTGDFEDALGLLRTQELLSNDRYTGVAQMFGTEVDFGFSKTKEESFAKWTHERVLYDAVRAIRLFHPLVITATFIGGVTDGHGQHQVSGEIAQEAFKAAADPNVFPDMIAEGILPWQALKVYARVPMGAITDKGLFDYATGQYTPARFTNYVTGEVSTTIPSADITVHEGTPDPLLTRASACDKSLPQNNAVISTEAPPNKSVISAEAQRSGETCSTSATPLSYVQFARIGLGLQRSQIGPGVRNAPSGAFDVAYHLYGSCLPNSPNLRLCRLDAGRASPVKGPSANGATYTSPGQRSGFQSSQYPEGLKARYIPAGGTAPGSTVQPTTDSDFFTGIDTSVDAIATLAPSVPGLFANEWTTYKQNVAIAQQVFDPTHPEKCAPPLAKAKRALQNFVDIVQGTDFPELQKQNVLHELKIKLVQLNDALILALNIELEASTTKSSEIFANAKVPATLRLTADPSSLRFLSLALIGDYRSFKPFECLPPGQPQPPGSIVPQPFASPLIRSCTMPGDLTGTISRPYFHRANIETPYYELQNQELRNAPSTPTAITAWAVLQYDQTDVQVGRVLQSGSQPVSIVPHLSVSLSSHAIVLPNGTNSFSIETFLHPVVPALKPLLSTHPGWGYTTVISNSYTPGQYNFKVFAPPSAAKRDVWAIEASVTLDKSEFMNEGFRPVGYPGLPTTNYFTPATTRIVPVDLKLPTHHHIAYLPGTGDAVPEALASIGLAPTILTVSDLTTTNLAQYDAVILGVRTYNAHPDLHGAPTQALLDYAKKGGNVLVQYQSPEFTAADAPYPLSLGSSEKVVDETAPVQLLDHHTSLLTSPNQITPTDFDNWIEERGHGFLSTWDNHYTALTETHDPGQAPQRGGLITTSLGKGHWTYCAFALYRQLPEAIPGAYRLFVNLLTP